MYKRTTHNAVAPSTIPFTVRFFWRVHRSTNAVGVGSVLGAHKRNKKDWFSHTTQPTLPSLPQLRHAEGSCCDWNLVQISNHPFSFLTSGDSKPSNATRQQKFPLPVRCADKQPPWPWQTQGTNLKKKKKRRACIFIAYPWHELGCFAPLRHLPGTIKSADPSKHKH